MNFYAIVQVAPSPVDPSQGPETRAFCTVGGLHPVTIAVDLTRRTGRVHIVTFYAPIDDAAIRAFSSIGGMVVAPSQAPANEPPPLPILRAVPGNDEAEG